MKTIIIDISSILFYGGLFYVMQVLTVVIMSKLEEDKVFELSTLNPFKYIFKCFGGWVLFTVINILFYSLIVYGIEKLQNYNWIIQF